LNQAGDACEPIVCGFGEQLNQAGDACEPIVCGFGEQLNQAGDACEPIVCGFGEQLNQAGDACEPTVCGFGEQLNQAGDACEPIVCGFGEQLNQAGDACEPIVCGFGEQLNQAGNACEPIVCGFGEQLNQAGNACEPIVCGFGEQLNQAGNACEPIVCPFGLVLDGNVCVPPEVIDETGGGITTEESSTFIIPVTGVCVPFSVEEKFVDKDLEILAILNNLCNYNISLDVVPEDIPVEIDHLSGLEITLLLGDSIVTQLPPRTSMQLFFEIPEEMTTPEELVKHEFVVMYWDPSAKNGDGEWVELDTTVENGQAVVLLTPGTPLVYPASFALIDKNTIEEAYVPSTTWINDLYVSLSQWFTSLAW
jgi:hypothetical protein